MSDVYLQLDGPMAWVGMQIMWPHHIINGQPFSGVVVSEHNGLVRFRVGPLVQGFRVTCVAGRPRLLGEVRDGE